MTLKVILIKLIIILKTCNCQEDDISSGPNYGSPYQFWQPLEKLTSTKTPVVRSRKTTDLEPKKYGFYYGKSIGNIDLNITNWEIQPIQIPNDLVGAVNERNTIRPSEAVVVYPSSATPHYGIHPGRSDSPLHNHPQNLPKDVKSNTRRRYRMPTKNPTSASYFRDEPFSYDNQNMESFIIDHGIVNHELLQEKSKNNNNNNFDVSNYWSTENPNYQNTRHNVYPEQQILSSNIVNKPDIVRHRSATRPNRRRNYQMPHRKYRKPMRPFSSDQENIRRNDQEPYYDLPIHEFYPVTNGTGTTIRIIHKTGDKRIITTFRPTFNRPNMIYSTNSNVEHSPAINADKNKVQSSAHLLNNKPWERNDNDIGQFLPIQPNESSQGSISYPRINYGDIYSNKFVIGNRFSETNTNNNSQRNNDIKENSIAVTTISAIINEHIKYPLETSDHHVENMYRPSEIVDHYWENKYSPSETKDNSAANMYQFAETQDHETNYVDNQQSTNEWDSGPYKIHDWKNTNENIYRNTEYTTEVIQENPKPYNIANQKVWNNNDNTIHKNKPFQQTSHLNHNYEHPPLRHPQMNTNTYNQNYPRPLNTRRRQAVMPKPNRRIRPQNHGTRIRRIRTSTPNYYESNQQSTSVLDTNFDFASLGIERITDSDSSLLIPGSLTVLAVGLALFYFNFVWFPTPVVTARLMQLLSETNRDVSDFNSTVQENALQEVSAVFRALEEKYPNGNEFWTNACRSRLVCQVHQEFPALLTFTETSSAILRFKFSITPPKGSNSWEQYLSAAKKGTEKTPCGTHFPLCDLPEVTFRPLLERFFITTIEQH